MGQTFSSVSAFFRGFRYAARGLLLCLHERNFRFHLAFALQMWSFLLPGRLFVLNRMEFALLALATALVLAAEAFNTAIEAASDLICPRRHPLVARVKDISAGAVLLCVFGAIAVGVCLLWDPVAFRLILFNYMKSPPRLLARLASILLCLFFVFWKSKTKPQTTDLGRENRRNSG